MWVYWKVWRDPALTKGKPQQWAVGYYYVSDPPAVHYETVKIVDDEDDARWEVHFLNGGSIGRGE